MTTVPLATANGGVLAFPVRRHSMPDVAHLVTAFLVALAVPLVLQAGPVRLSAYRLVLIAAFLPCLFHWLRMARSWTIADLAIASLALWSVLSFLVVKGARSGIEPAGIIVVETLGPWMLARVFIRSADAFRAVVRSMLVIVLILLPFALIETITGQNILLHAFDMVGQVMPDVEKPRRWGLDRVQGPFEHPILFGVYSGAFFAVCAATARSLQDWLAVAVIGFCAFLSLSSGPIAALSLQIGLLAAYWLLPMWRAKWWVLGTTTATALTIAELASNSSLIEVLIARFAFDPATAYNRLLIWEWGWVNIWANPVFGLGFGDWERLWFMTDSVDLFWIRHMMVNGIPAGALHQLAFWAVVIGLLSRRFGRSAMADLRAGLVIGLLGLYAAGFAVHVWNATYVLYVFLLGSACWMIESPARPASRRPLLS